MNPGRHTSPRVRRRAAAGAVVGLAALGIGLAPVAASASTTHKKPLSLLQQGLNFYKGQTITLISPDNVGGGFDTTARAVAPFMAQYLHATINVTNDSPAATIAGQDLMAASTPNGLTIGMVNAGTDAEAVVTHSAGVNFNPQKVQYLGGNNPSGADFECNTSSGLTSFASVVNSKTPVTEVVVSTGVQTLSLGLINQAFGINAKVINGYTSTALELGGQEAGSGECSVLGINTPAFASYDAGGKAKILMVTGLPNPATAFYSEDTAAQSFVQAEKQFPAKTKLEAAARAALLNFAGKGVGHEFNAPARTPAAEVAALRAAVQYALTNVQCEDKLLQNGQPNGWVTGPRALADYKAEVASLAKVKGLVATALGVSI